MGHSNSIAFAAAFCTISLIFSKAMGSPEFVVNKMEGIFKLSRQVIKEWFYQRSVYETAT